MLESSIIENDKKAIYKDVHDIQGTVIETKSLKNRDFLTKPSKNIDDNVKILENIINAIIEAKVNNACMIVQYGENITLDKEPYQKYTIKEILEHYINNDSNKISRNDYKKYLMKLDEVATLKGRIREYERLLTSDKHHILQGIAHILVPYDNDGITINIDDVVDDISYKFNEFNNIYNDVCDDDNNINLTNERGDND